MGKGKPYRAAGMEVIIHNSKSFKETDFDSMPG